MLINGKAAGQNFQTDLAHLASLDSSFPEYLGTKVQYVPPYNTAQVYNQGRQFLQQGNTQMALQQFQAAISQTPKGHPNNQFLGQIYSDISLIQATQGNYKDAEVNCKKAIAGFQNSKNYYFAELSHKALANIHKANGSLESYEKESQNLLNNSLKNNNQNKELEARLALASINRVQNKHEEALKHYSKSYDLQQGKIDYDAVRVEQHEVGFSNQKIGTDNIQQCVAVILHDPITKKTALAHVDKVTDTGSLANVVANFPEGTKLNAYLVGGRDRSEQSKAVSDDNILRVLSELKNHSGVDIKSADIGDKGAPSGIVFDPQTAELKHAVPGKHHETTNERKLLHNLQPSLNFAFDLTRSSKMNGPKLTNFDKESLVQRYLSIPKGPIQNEAWTAAMVHEPLVKTVEKIRKETPQIFESAVAKHLNSHSKLSIEQKKMAMSDVKNLLADPNNSVSKIEKSIENHIQGNNVSIPTMPNKPKLPTHPVKTMLIATGVALACMAVTGPAGLPLAGIALAAGTCAAIYQGVKRYKLNKQYKTELAVATSVKKEKEQVKDKVKNIPTRDPLVQKMLAQQSQSTHSSLGIIVPPQTPKSQSLLQKQRHGSAMNK